MKKVSLLALALSMAAPAYVAADAGNTCPKSFQGFHLGGNLGYGIGKGKFNFSRTDLNVPDALPYTVRNDLGVSGVDGGVNVGYTHRFGNWGLGLEFVANWANSDGSKRTSGEYLFNNVVETETVSHSARLNNSLQLRANFSYVIRDVVAPKLILGWDNSSWRTKISNTDTFFGVDPIISNSRSKRYNAFLWGAGVDFLATKHFIVGLEYVGTIANKKSHTNSPVDVFGQLDREYRRSWKPQYNTFKVVAKFIY